MKIVIVQGAFYPIPPAFGGAVEKIWYALATFFADKGHSVIHLSRTYGGRPKKEEIDGVMHIRLQGFDAPRGLLRLKALDFVYSLFVLARLPRCDLVVTHTFWLPILLAIFRPGTPVYVHVARFPRGQMRLYKNVSRLQTVSSVIAERIEQEVPEMKRKIAVIPNPLGSVWFEQAPGRAPNSNHVILFVGRIHPEKGLDILLEAFSRVNVGKAFTLRIIGSCLPVHGGAGQAYLNMLMKLLSDRGEENVDFVGPIFDDDILIRYYDEASLFVYPSIAVQGEACPLAPVEAMARSCIPVVSDLRCFDKYINDGETGFRFLFSDDRSEMIASLEQVLNKCLWINGAEQGRIRQNMKEKAKVFSLDTIGTQYLKDFETITSKLSI